jgi:PTH1 family peptidyl-tRNA hydrolase
MNEAHLIIGLGNPGAKYEGTRHNVGFLALDRLAEQWGGTWSEEKKFKARMSRVTVGQGNIHLCQPQTYMNLSGESVGAVCDYFRIEARQVLVIVDDAELAFGQLRMRASGSSGGHNGLVSVEQSLATEDYLRLRIGVGRPPEEAGMAGYVLGKLSPEELLNMAQTLEVVQQQCECWLQYGVERAMNEFNGKLDFPDKKTDKDIIE